MDKDTLVFDIEPDEIDLFVQEVNEHVQTIEKGFLDLEQWHDAEVLNEVFRAAHTVKSIAATIGHQRMADLTHALETLFDQMRQGEIELTADRIDELLMVVDTLRALRDEVISLEPVEVDLGWLIDRLNQIGKDGASSQNGQRSAETANVTLALSEELREKARELQGQGLKLYDVEVITSADCFAPGARLMQAIKLLERAGQIVAQEPSLDELLEDRQEGVLLSLLATNHEVQAIAEALGMIPELQDVLIEDYDPEQDADLVEHVSNHAPVVPDIRRNGASSMVRISVERLDMLMNLVGELVTDRTRLHQNEDLLRTGAGVEHDVQVAALGETILHFSRVVDQLQNEVMQMRMLPIGNLFSKFPRLVRDQAQAAGKQVTLVLEGETTELDRSVMEAISDPLLHLVRNAIDHGIERPEEREALGKSPSGTIRIAASHEEGHIVITLQDDGRGLDPVKIRQAAIERGVLSKDDSAQLDDDAVISMIFQPNVSTAEKVTEISGRGVGLDVVLTNIRKMSGAVVVESDPGAGTMFRITLPLTLAIMQAMLVGMGDEIYAIPLTGIVETLYLAEVKLESVKGREVIQWRDRVLPLVRMREFYAHPALKAVPVAEERQAIVVVSWGKMWAGLVADRLIGKQEIVIKPLSGVMGNIPGISGCSILGDGRVILITDITGIINVMTSN